MAKKPCKKSSCSKHKIQNKKTTTKKSKDCDGGVCPIDKKSKSSTQSTSPQVSLCSKMLAALFFWKKA